MREPRLYDVLNVAPTAEPEVIEAAYRVLMKKYHPDRGAGTGAGPTAADINAAFAVLRDPFKRAEYDRRIRSHEAPAMPPAGGAHFASAWAAAHPHPAMAEAPRRMNFAAWTGWGVALAVGCFAIAMPLERAIVTGPAVEFAPSEPELLAVDAALSRLSPAETPVSPAAPERQVAQPELREQVVAEAAPLPATVAPVVEMRPTAPAASRPPRSPAAPRRPSRAETRQSDRDFLEREGYIY